MEMFSEDSCLITPTNIANSDDSLADGFHGSHDGIALLWIEALGPSLRPLPSLNEPVQQPSEDGTSRPEE